MRDRRTEQCLEEIGPGEERELLRVASELYARERAELKQTARREELFRAAAEAGLPAEYLERAATVIHERRAARLRRHRRWRTGAGAALCLTVGIAVLSMQAEVPQPVAPPPPPVPPSLPAFDPPPTPVPITRFTFVELGEQATQSLDAPMLNTAGNDLSDLGHGIRTLGGVQFRPDGVVLVGPGETSGTETEGAVPLPRKVSGIPVGRRARQLHFLQGTNFSAPPGIRIGGYVVHYANGDGLETSIRMGEDVLDWWAGAGPETAEGLNHVVWRGTNAAAARHDTSIRLFMKTWENPHPEMTIESLDMITGDQLAGPGAPAPFLVAVTAE